MKPQNPASPTPAPPPDGSAPALQARIREAETRLVLRQARLRQRGAALGRRARHALAPRRLLLPAASALLGGAALVSLVSGALGRGRPVADGPPAAATPAPTPAPAPTPVPWASLLALAWPLLPMAWRSVVSPATAATLLDLGLPLARRAFGPRRARSPGAPP